MPKRAVDLSVEELGAMGAKAARRAVQKAQQAGLVVTGTIDIFENEQPVSSIAQVLPSGTVTLVREEGVEMREGHEAVIVKPVPRSSR
jgi:hypothetical protein